MAKLGTPGPVAPQMPPAPPVAPVPPVMAPPGVPQPQYAPPVAPVAPPAPIAPPAPVAPPVAVAPSPMAQPAMPEGLQAQIANQVSAIPQSTGGGGWFTGNDLSAVADDNYALLPPDLTYEALVEGLEPKVSQSGNKMLTAKLRVIWPAEFKNTIVYDNIVLTSEALWKFKAFVRACCLLSEDGSRALSDNIADYIGNIVRFNIKHDTYNDTVRNKVNGGYIEGFAYAEDIAPVSTPQPAPQQYATQQPQFPQQ